MVLEKIKVMQFIPSLNMGGAETLVKDYCVMSSSDTEMVVVIIEQRNGSENEKRIEAAGVKIISIKERLRWCETSNVVVRGYRYFAHRYFYPREIAEIVREEQPSCIHVHLGQLAHFAKITEHLKGIRLFYTCHTVPSVLFEGKMKKEKFAAKKLIDRVGLRLIALHPQMAEEINAMFGVNNTLVVRNGVNFKRFQDKSFNRDEKRESLGIPKNAFVIGHVGRFVKSKNHVFLVDVFNELLKRKENAFLLLVGEGKTRGTVIDKLNALGLNNRCMTLDNRGDIPEIMKVMDVFVFPSEYEGLGIVLIEAQAAGLKCVISSSVTDEVLLTENIISIGLDKSPSEWCDVILDDKIKNERVTGELYGYDMINVIGYLEDIYRGEV